MNGLENLVGFALPPIIGLVNQKVENSNLRFAISVLLSLLVATVLNLQELSYGSVDAVLGSAGLVFAQAQIAYRVYWRNEAPVRKMLSK